MKIIKYNGLIRGFIKFIDLVQGEVQETDKCVIVWCPKYLKKTQVVTTILVF